VVNPCEVYTEVNATNVAKIQAESYCEQFGVQTENTLDAGGGENIGYVDAGDWMTYPVHVSDKDMYVIDFRLASFTGGALKVLIDNKQVATLTVNNTGNWQTWKNQTVSTPIDTGKHIVKIEATTAGWNLNYFSVYKDKTITGVVETSANTDFNIYPNPATTQINLSKTEDWKLLDLFGMVVKEGNSQSIDIQELPSGVYVIQAKNKSIRVLKK
jgi:hypothetical protein